VAGSLDYYRKSAAIREAIRAGSKAFRDQVQTRLAGVHGYMAGDLSLQDDPGSALALQSNAHAILAAQVAADPQNSQLRAFLLHWRTARYWLQQSLNQLQTLKQQNLLAPYNLSEPDRVAREVANCDANLKRFARK
jgi:hypothetical protein